jgi:hypothetical protein
MNQNNISALLFFARIRISVSHVHYYSIDNLTNKRIGFEPSYYPFLVFNFIGEKSHRSTCIPGHRFRCRPTAKGGEGVRAPWQGSFVRRSIAFWVARPRRGGVEAVIQSVGRRCGAVPAAREVGGNALARPGLDGPRPCTPRSNILPPILRWWRTPCMRAGAYCCYGL